MAKWSTSALILSEVTELAKLTGRIQAAQPDRSTQGALALVDILWTEVTAIPYLDAPRVSVMQIAWELMRENAELSPHNAAATAGELYWAVHEHTIPA